MPRPANNNIITQTNLRIPHDLKEWAMQQADENFQSLSGFISKLIKEEKDRREGAKPSA